ncbi:MULTISPECIES: L-lactate permease [unclassified Rhodococcus (in: high G+C Gram-positive bacteria)]|uniref:L-lactate permease n=1 Tax=unclassified Rhodococcus (in: high G+C Gram-positive bacteria) TaxID=192944 RepID=UPI0011ECE3A5|nr:MULTISPECIES: L-lactate permease [unclassified Rhodococcus (in: high G+C Gram-positive bacteria)]KAA0924067.1 L-lactate permease [Rhodococcus sp. ANT_H53B]MDI9928666.1 L-lactate permease [Rhodococcus sp. IEGM 1341]
MYTPDLEPLDGSVGLSAAVACLPLLTVFVTLGLLRWKAHFAGLAGLVVALAVAVLAYDMPVNLAGLSATQGFAFGLFPIVWIVICAIWLYELTVTSGRFDDLRRIIDAISDDPRIQAIIIAFGFGGLLEALAGFGAPVAITGIMLLAIGFAPMRAAVVVLLANTAPVAFGAIGIPILTAGNLTGIDYHEIGAYVGHQTPFIALFVPLFIAFLTDGRRGVAQTWPVALAVGVVFAVAQCVSATWISVELTDIIASLAGIAAAVVVLRFWKPTGSDAARERILLARDADLDSGSSGSAPITPAPIATRTIEAAPLTTQRVWLALFPYLLVIAVFSVAKLWSPVARFLASTDIAVPWPGLDGNILTAAGSPATTTIYKFTWLSTPGTLLLICGVIVAAVYRVSAPDAARLFGSTLIKLRFSALTVGAVLALAYVMNQSGQTITIGTWIAGTGAFFAYLSPILGWLGTAVTGSDTSANALFATLQQTAAINAGIDPTLLVAANTSGGVVGKMISPQNLAIAASAVGLVGRESEIFRKVIGWSLGLLLAICLLVGLQSSVLAWMLP